MEELDLQKLKEVDIKDIHLEELVDITDIKIDPNLPKEEKILEYIKQIKNPYCYKYKNFKVKVVFNEDENAKTLEECLSDYIKNL